MRKIIKSVFILTSVMVSASGFAQRETLTLNEMSTIAQQMEFFFIDSSYYTTIENLDDILSSDTTLSYQNINDSGGALVFNPANALPFRRNLSGFQWGGPYLSGFGRRSEGASGDYDEGTLLDLATEFSPYYFYTPIGLLEPKTGDLSLRYYGDDFDVYTIVSHGLDGVQSDDDLFWSMGTTVSSFLVSSASFSPNQARSSDSYEFRIKGYQFGTNEGVVLYDGAPAPGITISSWSPTLVVGTTNTLPGEETEVTLQNSGGGVSIRSINASFNLPETAVFAWSLYE